MWLHSLSELPDPVLPHSYSHILISVVPLQCQNVTVSYLVSPLVKGLLLHIWKKYVMDTPIRNKGCLLPARKRKWTTEFVGLHWFDELVPKTLRCVEASGEHKCTVYPDAIMSPKQRTQQSTCSNRGISTAVCKPGIDYPRGGAYPTICHCLIKTAQE